ncbi:MAG: hypothetical protein IRZ14_19390 [Chloroflexi bacterium]|nr:hypothetical protein [Chloroflexota bacterium]
MSVRHTEPRPDGFDDIERLLARLEPPPVPPGLGARVLAYTIRAPRREWSLGLVVALLGGLLAVLVAAASGYAAGRELVHAGALELLRLGLEERELIVAAPGDYLLALAEALPWGWLAATLLSVGAVFLAARPLGRGVQPATR